MAEKAPEKIPDKAPEKAPKTAPEKVHKEKKSWSLSAKLRMMVIYIIIVILLAFFVSVYFFSRKERMDSAEREAENLISSITNGIHSDMEGYKELSRQIMVEEHVVRYLRADASEIDRDMVNITLNGIFDILNVTVNVDSVFIFREDGKYMSTNRAE
ncbi:MAG: cache domain-containing protein, partial [Lachnospiraceae bacterium]|nr:cache domain-containing protein [Lachnospiraceae bacterium]